MANPGVDPVDLDVFDPDFIRCPFAAYHRLQAGDPAAYVAHGKGFWFISRHDLVREVAGDAQRFSSESGPLGTTTPSPEAMARMAAITPVDGMPGQIDTLLTLDPPGHTRNRRLISRAFTAASVRRYESLTRQVCQELIRSWRTGSVLEFVADFAVPLPVRIIANALDVPDDRVDDFKRWSDAAVGAIGADLSDDEAVENHRLLLDLAGFVQTEIDRKRAAGPAADVMSKLVHASLADDETSDLGPGVRRRLDDDEIHSIVRQVLVAGNETTTNLLTQLIVHFSDEERWWTRMQNDRELIPAVVEEGLRITSPSAVNQRATAGTVDFHGVTIPPGDVVLIGYLAANHDPGVFSDPERFDPGRGNLAEHLAFGRGIHFCPGAALARMEARIALEELTAAIASYDVPGRDALRWNNSFQLRAIEAVPFVPTMRSSR